MTDYPITDEAEIAKLPDGFYLTVKGYSVEKWGERMQLGGWPDKSIDAAFTSDFIASHHGGIAGRLVLEGEAEAQRDRAFKLLRVADCPDPGCGGQGWYPDYDNHGEACQVRCQWCDERDALLAEREMNDAV